MFGPSGPTLTASRRERFEADRRILADTHPGIRHLILDTGNAVAEGTVMVDIGASRWAPVQIRMEFGADYPQVGPRVFDASRRWKPNLDRHLYHDGEFCLWMPDIDPPDVRTPDGFRLFLQKLHLFLRDQFVFDDIGRWPTSEWEHGANAARAQHAYEQLSPLTSRSLAALWPLVLGASCRPASLCPCGSRRRFGDCHRDGVRRVARMSPKILRGQLKDDLERRITDVE